MMNNKEVDKLIADTLDAHMEDVYRAGCAQLNIKIDKLYRDVSKEMNKHLFPQGRECVVKQLDKLIKL